jgi:hypothetical protein
MIVVSDTETNIRGKSNIEGDGKCKETIVAYLNVISRNFSERLRKTMNSVRIASNPG